MHCLSQRIMIKVEGQKKFYFNLIWPLEEIEVAAKHLERSVRAHPNSALLYKLLMSCYNILSDSRKFDKACKKFKRYYDDLNSLDVAVIVMLHSYFSKREIARNAELSLYINHKLDEKMKELEQIVEMDPKFYPAIVPLLHIYVDKSKLDEYATLLQRWANYCDSPIAYEGLGRVFLKNKYYKQASEYFEKALLSYPDRTRKIICAILKDFSLGLYHWQNDDSNYRLSSPATFQYFSKCANLVKIHGVQDFEDLQYLPLTLDFAVQCFSLFQISKDLHEVKDNVRQLYQELCIMLPHGKSLVQYIIDLQKISSFVADFLHVSSLYLSYLGYLLKEPTCIDRIKPIIAEHKEPNKVFWKEIRQSMKDRMVSNLGTSRGNAIVESLDWLQKMIKESNIDGISRRQQRSIVEKMRDRSASSTGGLKSQGMNKIYEKVNELQFNIKSMNVDVKGEFKKSISGLRRLDKSIAEVREIIAGEEISIAEKKIKILTNEGIQPISKLSYLEENKHKFYIWVDERKPEVRINNKVQEKMANAIQSINLLVMLLEKHDNLVSHEEIFDALDRKGRKCNSSTIRVSRKKYRPNVVKMINNLHNKTNGRLKQHICSVPGCGYRFDLKNIKFCIIYKKIMNKNYTDI